MADDNAAAAADPHAGAPGYYPATDHAIPYMSDWSRIHDDDATKATLRHLGCNYLGTQGSPPTLIALKRHAQSLAILISRLSPSVKTGRVDGNPIFDDRVPAQDANGVNVNTVDGRLELNDAFDWLADLTQPYNNDDPNHHRPLNILSNEVEGRHEVLGTAFHCPLTRVTPRDAKEERSNPYKADVSRTPYASHHLLAMHANACLEHLDHEFSATGGILSMIPEDGQGANTAELRAAQNSLLGQLLLYVQGLALRNHEMDMTNAKMADALAGEAVVPMQHLSLAGPDGRSGREIAYPQDRWVLVNSGDDVWAHLHDALDRAEAALDARELAWAQDDTNNDSAWRTDRTDVQHARGIVDVDISTRFYRLQGQGRSTIFVLPAFASRPATEWSTRMALYARPTVVGTVAATWPQRASEFEKRWTTRNADADQMRNDYNALQAKSNRDDATIQAQRYERDAQTQRIQNLTTELARYTNRQPAAGDAPNADFIATLNAQIVNLQNQLAGPNNPGGAGNGNGNGNGNGAAVPDPAAGGGGGGGGGQDNLMSGADGP
ncbi:hypothetical protein Daus18300_001661 [Diaporthe australafricana]|uniref:Uncharacterized protein n=1 Tax=Diaporthe australafricana TaxID=127596 RepID=A0ABR3XW58_9PEZI